MKPTARKKLKLRIIGMYNSIKNFSEAIGYTSTSVSYILMGLSNGAPRFWELARQALKIPKDKLYLYQEKENEHGKIEPRDY